MPSSEKEYKVLFHMSKGNPLIFITVIQCSLKYADIRCAFNPRGGGGGGGGGGGNNFGGGGGGNIPFGPKYQFNLLFYLKVLSKVYFLITLLIFL